MATNPYLSDQANAITNQVTGNLQNRVIVNPGEFVAVVKKKVGTAPSAGVVAHTVTFNAGWI